MINKENEKTSKHKGFTTERQRTAYVECKNTSDTNNNRGK
jgi:hypothetical protein